jgi:hypothetical protein
MKQDAASAAPPKFRAANTAFRLNVRFKETAQRHYIVLRLIGFTRSDPTPNSPGFTCLGSQPMRITLAAIRPIGWLGVRKGPHALGERNNGPTLSICFNHEGGRPRRGIMIHALHPLHPPPLLSAPMAGGTILPTNPMNYSDNFEKWQPVGESNPSYQVENLVS